ncbi:MAG: RecBCD enzyme subunit RecD, partial [Actinomycetota bacterium]
MSAAHVRIPGRVAHLAPYVEAGVLGPAEVHLADWAARSADGVDPLVVLALAMAAWAAQHGHACADLAELEAAVGAEQAERADGEWVPLAWPVRAEWLAALRANPDVVRQADAVDATAVLDPRPLVLHGQRVYLQRYWADECAVATSLRQRAADVAGEATGDAAATLDAVLPRLDDGEPNLQRQAADLVLRNRVSMVVGGPGTGKTYSVSRLLAVLLEQDPQLRIALAAPTGKAAARLQESIAAALAEPDVVAHISGPVRTMLAAAVPTTIHRLLGPMGAHQRFRHDAADPLPHDLVVVDETSMVSLPLLARLLEAVRPEARLVLIGDPDQLESVELGAVLADLVQVAVTQPAGPLAGRGERLLRGHRYGGNTPIARFADAVRRGDAPAALAHLRQGADADGSGIRLHATADPMAPAVLGAVEKVVAPALRRLKAAATAGQDDKALQAAAEFRILCAHRRGPFGAADWNRLAERWMCGADGAGAAWFAGRPLLATRNDPRLGLANGDTGVVVRRDGRLVAVFRTALGVQTFETVQLEDVETAYAMTIH